MAPQDSFIEDEDDTCPLCIEEFDLSDRNFKPCPCGYRICQFCFNNLKNNLNGLCPACRRPYDEKTMEYKIVTQEEVAEFRANIQKNQKKRAAEQRQKEKQKIEVDKGNRKNLVGVRVVQKNLVYVTGLTPTVPEDELLKTLRKPEFFGQYGNIQKISISNRKAPDGAPQSLGIYVTFDRREDAARCIQAVNGSQNGDRILKAQLGTTKYCSAWLRHETCGNRQCMFLHEEGDEEDSYTRKDLSSLNSIDTQRVPQNNGSSSSRSASRQQVSGPRPTAEPMIRTSSKEGSDNGDGPALPATANWARTRSRRGSHATSGAGFSPAISNSLPVTAESAQEAVGSTPATPALSSRKAEKQPAAELRSRKAPALPARAFPKDPFSQPDFNDLLRRLEACPATAFPPPTENEESYVPLFDPYGGLRRRSMREEDENRLTEQEDQVENREPSEGEPESGSLALGGEPEDRDQGRDDGSVFDQRRNPAQLPIQRNSTDGLFGPSLGSTYAQQGSAIGSIPSRTMTPQQQLFMRPQGGFVENLPPGISTPQSGIFQNQGHTRQQSRFNFNTENGSNSTNVRLTANPRIMAQQSSMMPSSYSSPGNGQLYVSSMPGPPPGLKSTGTPPITGGLYGQGFGGSGFGSKDSVNNEVLSLLSRGRGLGSSSAHDAGKHDELPPLDESSVDALVSDSYPEFESQGLFSHSLPTTPAPPPGLGFSHSQPPVQFGETTTSVASGQTPQGTPVALPILPAIPRPVTPMKPKQSVKASVKNDTAPGSSDAKKTIKEYAVESGLSKDIAAQSSTAPKEKVLQDEDFPALDAANASSPPKVTPASLSKPAASAKISQTKKAQIEMLAKTATQKATARSENRPVLDIAAATKTVIQTKDTVASQANRISDHSNAGQRSVASSALPTPTPTTAVSSPLARAAPKTLRLVQTPKTELPPNIAPSAATAIRAAAVAAGHRPGTPASEAISDSASVVSASISASRTSSPPPSKVGSATARATTKSQQRKQRQKATKEASAAIINEATPVEPEAEVAPIIGRKKKQKKEKKEKLPDLHSPAVSRPESPVGNAPTADTSAQQDYSGDKASTMDEKKGKAGKAQPAAEDSAKAKEQKEKEIKIPLKSPAPIDTSIRLNESTKTTVLTPDYINPNTEARQEPIVEGAVGEIPTYELLLQSLVESGELPNAEEIAFFKQVLPNYRNEIERQVLPTSITPTVKSVVTKEDEDELNAFRPVRKRVNGYRILLTPNGDFIPNLTQDEEDRYLELQALVAKTNGLSTAFTAPKHTSGNGFTLIKGRAVPNGQPTFFPLGPGSLPPDPIAKMHREEAIGCINQHVLPSLNLSNYKPNSSIPNVNNVNLQSLAPWINMPESKEKRRLNFPRSRDLFDGGHLGTRGSDGLYSHMQNGDDANENWDDDDDEVSPSPAIGSTPLMTAEEAEAALLATKKATEAAEKKLRHQTTKIRRQFGLH